ncbi:MAG TPA: ABC transporter ATP-binding protein [Armatimonadota bacterium]|nr:ABC transporter ATP-binding protein [Armatimonadota bacterium]
MRTIRRLMTFAKKYWHWIMLTVVCMLAFTVSDLLFPQVLRLIVDRCLRGHQYHLLPRYAEALLLIAVVRGFFQFGQLYLPEFVAQRTIFDIRNRLFDHIQRLSFTYHDEAETGQLISRATSDVDVLRRWLGHGLMHLLSDGLIFLGILLYFLSMNWQLALVALSCIPILIATVFKYGTKIRPLFTAVQNQRGEMTTAIQQNLMGIRVVKSFAREKHEVGKFDKQTNELLERSLDTARVSAFYSPVMDFLAAVSTAFVIWYGGIQLVRGDISLGEWLVFYAYLGMLIRPVRMMGWVVNQTQNAVASADRIFEILDTHREVHLKDGKQELAKCRGEVVFQDVSFSYGDGSRVLSGLSFKVNPGETVALVGPTGSGKSTVINLLPRFYDVTEGAILVDGVDIRSYRLESLRRQIGIVSQESFLFGDSARENIAYGRPDADLEEVIEAAKAANIHEFIDSLPDEYETRIGERGVNLSGGQKQRVAIARALLLNPPILILDDSTSSVDTETEAQIQMALLNLMESRTTFVIAQRISTVKRAHKILVLDKGRIVQMGTHEELLAQGGLYADICRLQFGEEAAGE